MYRIILTICMLITISVNALNFAIGDDVLPLHPLCLNAMKYNGYNSSGEKDGIWIDRYDGSLSLVTILYYKNGLLDGPFITYSGNQEYYMSLLGNYKNDKPTGDWFMFYENGVVAGTINNISINKDFLKEQRKYYPDSLEIYQSYGKEYRQDGTLECEGWSISTINLLDDNSNCVGEWLFYDNNGNVISKKHYD